MSFSLLDHQSDWHPNLLDEVSHNSPHVYWTHSNTVLVIGDLNFQPGRGDGHVKTNVVQCDNDFSECE